VRISVRGSGSLREIEHRVLRVPRHIHFDSEEVWHQELLRREGRVSLQQHQSRVGGLINIQLEILVWFPVTSILIVRKSGIKSSCGDRAV